MFAARLICPPIGQRLTAFGRDVLGSWPIDWILIALVILCFFVWCLISPSVRRSLANIFAVLAVGAGIGVLTWAACSIALGEEIRSLGSLPTLVSASIDAIGLGAGSLAAGIAALVLTLGVRLGRSGEEIPHSAGVGIPRNHRL
jgi:hypothetical protein